MADVDTASRPISCASSRMPSQAGVKAAFSRPVTAGEDFTERDVNSPDLTPRGLEAIDDVLITQLKDALADPPTSARIRFRRCKEVELDEPLELSEPADIFREDGWDTDLDGEDETTPKDKPASELTLEELYLSVCRRLKVVPVSYFLRHVDHSSVSLKHRAMIASETTAIAKAFKKVLNIEKLNLEGNCMGNSGCQHLCEMLEDNQVLRALSMAENNLDDGSIKYINSMLAHNGTLKELSLSGNQLTDSSALILADCMEDCKLKRLDLSRNKFGERGGVILGPALSINVYLDALDLSWNQIRGAGALAVAKGLKENVHLAVCNLSWNGLSESGGLALADALLVNTNLKEIDVSSCRLTFPVAQRLAKVLLANEVLEVLKMANNPISTAGCLVIIEAVYKSPTSVLRYLDLYENPVEYEFLRVCQALTERKADFEVYHGPILRAGNTEQDIGKPAIDIVRLSQKPIMILKGNLTVNAPQKVRQCLTKHRIKSNCTAESLIKCLQELDSSYSMKQLTDAVGRLAMDEGGKIIISELV